MAASLYGQSRAPHPSIRDVDQNHGGISVRRMISCLSVFVSPKQGSAHRILAGGDLNMGRIDVDGRGRSVIVRMGASRVEYLGPITPDEKRAPTFHTGKQKPTITSTPLGRIFTFKSLSDVAASRAMNGTGEGGRVTASAQRQRSRNDAHQDPITTQKVVCCYTNLCFSRPRWQWNVNVR